MKSGSIRRLILTLATGYLTVCGVRQIPYEFDNEWLVLVPALLLVYAITVWLDGRIFKDGLLQPTEPSKQPKKIVEVVKKGFGSD